MKISDQPFAVKVDLPCKLFCDSDARAELAGVVTNIDTSSLLLQLATIPKRLDIGDRARLEVALPTGPQQKNGSKYLSLRARLVAIEARPDGSHRLQFKLWRAKFADRLRPKADKVANGGGLGWRI